MVSPYQGLPPLYLAHNAAAVEPGGGWYYNFEYDRERERGLDFREDLFNPLLLKFGLAQCTKAVVIASTQPHDAACSTILRQHETRRRLAVVAAAPSPEPLVQRLAAAADQFIVRRVPRCCGRRSACASSHPTIRGIARVTKATPPAVIPPITRAPCGRG